jgi:protease-4
MGQFFKFLFASCLGLLLAFALIFGIGAIVIGQIASGADQPKPVKANTVLHLTLEQPIPEQTNNLEVDPFQFDRESVLGLSAMVDAIERAKEDDDIKGIFLEADQLNGAGMATASVLRDALVDFKESGKFVVAYAKYYSQGAYYLASTADALYVNPLGLVDFRGPSAQIPFFKDMLDKIGVDMQVYYAGKFKGATEPYRFNEMSKENRTQIRAYLNDIYDVMLEDLSVSRKLTKEELRRIANEYVGIDPQNAKTAGLVDDVAHRDVALDDLRERLGLEEDDKINKMAINEYAKSNPVEKDYTIKDKIAVIYAEGTIVDGKGAVGSIGDKKYVEYIREARQDDGVKAIVLRVNSPGGSAMASENIWRELILAKDEGKPVVVSMGDYAASGGYYISAPADSIFAEPNTLTGSIGVFSLIPNASKLMEDKLGIHFDTVKTGDLSVGITPFFPMSPQEQRLMQSRTEQMYETFLARVSEGRGMSRDSVHAIAQGRVWTGRAALDNGLVDALGGLDRALASAANLTDLEEYRITTYPKVKDPLQQLVEELLGEENVRAEVMVNSELGEWYPYYRHFKQIQDSKGAQARLPFIVPFN